MRIQRVQTKSLHQPQNGLVLRQLSDKLTATRSERLRTRMCIALVFYFVLCRKQRIDKLCELKIAPAEIHKGDVTHKLTKCNDKAQTLLGCISVRNFKIHQVCEEEKSLRELGCFYCRINANWCMGSFNFEFHFQFTSSSKCW